MDVLSSRMSLISSASFPVPLSPFFVSSLSVSTCLLIFNFSFFVIPSSYLTLLLLTHLMYIHSLCFHIYFLIFLPASIYSLLFISPSPVQSLYLAHFHSPHFFLHSPLSCFGLFIRQKHSGLQILTSPYVLYCVQCSTGHIM